MELVVGYQLLVLIVQVVLCSLIVLQQLEKLLYSVKPGAILVFLMEFPVFLNPNVLLIKHRQLVKIKVLMEPVYGLPHRLHLLVKLADYNCVLMPPLILILIQDVLHL